MIATRAIDDAQDRPCGDALAAAALTDDAERRALRHVEADAVDRVHGALVLREVRLQTANGQEQAIVHMDPRRPGARRQGS